MCTYLNMLTYLTTLAVALSAIFKWNSVKLNVDLVYVIVLYIVFCNTSISTVGCQRVIFHDISM